MHSPQALLRDGELSTRELADELEKRLAQQAPTATWDAHNAPAMHDFATTFTKKLQWVGCHACTTRAFKTLVCHAWCAMLDGL